MCTDLNFVIRLPYRKLFRSMERPKFRMRSWCIGCLREETPTIYQTSSQHEQFRWYISLWQHRTHKLSSVNCPVQIGMFVKIGIPTTRTTFALHSDKPHAHLCSGNFTKINQYFFTYLPKYYMRPLNST